MVSAPPARSPLPPASSSATPCRDEIQAARLGARALCSAAIVVACRGCLQDSPNRLGAVRTGQPPLSGQGLSPDGTCVYEDMAAVEGTSKTTGRVEERRGSLKASPTDASTEFAGRTGTAPGTYTSAPAVMTTIQSGTHHSGPPRTHSLAGGRARARVWVRGRIRLVPTTLPSDTRAPMGGAGSCLRLKAGEELTNLACIEQWHCESNATRGLAIWGDEASSRLVVAPTQFTPGSPRHIVNDDQPEVLQPTRIITVPRATDNRAEGHQNGVSEVGQNCAKSPAEEAGFDPGDDWQTTGAPALPRPRARRLSDFVTAHVCERVSMREGWCFVEGGQV